MGIRTKIMLGFIILASMLFLSGSISIFELTKLGHAVKGLIYDNYRSIDYSRNMLDALEKQEKSLLLFAQGDSTKAFKKYYDSQKIFLANIDSATQNLTLKEELAFIDSVRFSYSNFQAKSEEIFRSPNFSLDIYLNEVYPLVIKTNKQVKNLITINQRGLFNSAAFLEASAQRAILPGLIVILTSLIFTFVFTYLVHHYFVSPIIRLTKGINDYVKFNKPFDVPLETKDELSNLKQSIINLISVCKASNRKRDI